MTRSAIRIGGLGPISPPGIVWAGRELHNGMALAVDRLNELGGIRGRPLTLVFEDTHGRPEAGLAAIEKLRDERVDALAGEFHSVVADALVEPVQRLGLPFVCASATLDTITARRFSFVFRLAPPQSYGWRVYADFLAAERFRHVVALQEESSYWNGGAKVLGDRLAELGIRFTRFSSVQGATAAEWSWLVDAAISSHPAPDMLLLMVGYPEPLRAIVGRVHSRRWVPPVCFLGDPAGRAVFPDWWEVVATQAVRVPFLAYVRPSGLSQEGVWMFQSFMKQFNRAPTFVALEGYDSILTLARAFEDAETTDSLKVCDALRHLEVEGTRGMIKFSTEPEGVVHQQWKWPPVCVVAFSDAGQNISKVDLLWDANHGPPAVKRPLRLPNLYS